jgi:ubiquinone/menaquinone biosynthesis C-methylase UbiE
MNENSKEIERIKSVYNNYKKSKDYPAWTLSNRGNNFIIKERNDAIKNILIDNKIDLKNMKILELGAAAGNLVPMLESNGAKRENIKCVDIRLNKLEQGKKQFPEVDFREMDAGKLDFSDSTFDVITVFTLFSSILDREYRLKIACEILRTLKPNGFILYYDIRYNNPFNKNVIGIGLKDLDELFPNVKKIVKPITLLPPLSRKLGVSTTYLYNILSNISFLKTNYLTLFKLGR